MGSNILAFVLQNMTFNPDWHPENGWTRKHAPFIIQSAPELSTWINKSGSYLLKQNWISSPTGSGWRKLSAPLFWFVSASFRGRILFFSAIQPPASGSPGTPFPMCYVRPIGPETTFRWHNIPPFLLLVRAAPASFSCWWIQIWGQVEKNLQGFF